MEFEEMVRFAVENGASDIHLASNNLPSYRKNGKINELQRHRDS